MKKTALAILVLGLLVGLASHRVRSEDDRTGPGRLAAKSAVVIGSDTGSVLFGENEDTPRYPASTTKVLTALVVFGECDLNERVTVGDEANRAPLDSSKAGLRYGETLSVGDLLNAMLIASGNDAAYVLAVHASRHVMGNPRLSIDDSLDIFVRMMNGRAKKAGARHSNFMTPDGYHCRGQISTARDLALIARSAMRYGEFRRIVGTTAYRLPDPPRSRDEGDGTKRLLINTNRLLDPGSRFYCSQSSGIKTGHTDEAGYCLISCNQGYSGGVITVVMDSTERGVWEDTRKLIIWSLRKR